MSYEGSMHMSSIKEDWSAGRRRCQILQTIKQEIRQSSIPEKEKGTLVRSLDRILQLYGCSQVN